MQPIKLRTLLDAWNLDDDPSLYQLWPRLRTGDTLARHLVVGLTALLLVGTPTVTAALFSILRRPDFAFAFPGVLIGVSVGIITGLVFGIFVGLSVGAFGGFGLGITVGVIGSTVGSDVGHLLGSLVVCITISIFTNIYFGVSAGLRAGAAGGVLGFAFFAFPAGSLDGLEAGLYFLLFCGLLFRAPAQFLGVIQTATLTAVRHVFAVPYSRLARFLPIHYHDLIYLELPGLRSFLVGLVEEDERLGRQLMAEAAESIGQKRAARLALQELQARSLHRAARQRLYARTADLDLPFITEDLDDLLRRFGSAAADLRAATTSRNQLHRRHALDRAARTLAGARNVITVRRRPGRGARRLLPVVRVWLEVVEEEQAILAAEEAEHPQVPIPFVAGPALGPDHGELFKGRRDLVRIIDQDLTGDGRAPIVLIGQRRLGKSSLLNMLPIQLGTGTRVVTLNFQGLSGSGHREQPHRWIAEQIAREMTGVPSRLASEARWSATLDYLRQVDAALNAEDRRMLIALDEVERLEDGIREGWAGTELLDLIRAAGDVLVRIRFLLVTAYPLPRLGPHWVDRLINVLPRQLGPLTADEARSLICEPIAGFPDVYPPGGVERIIADTHGHPYLVQLVCDALCRHLNAEGCLQATPEDIELALDRAIGETTLFDELWRQRTDEERRLLQTLASGGGEPESAGRGALRDLEREGYLERRDGRWTVAVPMFAAWIAEST